MINSEYRIVVCEKCALSCRCIKFIFISNQDSTFFEQMYFFFYWVTVFNSLVYFLPLSVWMHSNGKSKGKYALVLSHWNGQIQFIWSSFFSAQRKTLNPLNWQTCYLIKIAALSTLLPPAISVTKKCLHCVPHVNGANAINKTVARIRKSFSNFLWERATNR